jgi:hypothetical protein
MGSVAYFLSGSLPMMSILNTKGTGPLFTVRTNLSVTIGTGKRIFRLMTSDEELSKGPLFIANTYKYM